MKKSHGQSNLTKLFFVTMFIIATSFSVDAQADARMDALKNGEIKTNIAFQKDKEYGSINVEAMVSADPGLVFEVFTDINSWRVWMPLLIDAFFYSPAAMQNIPGDPQKVDKDENFFAQIKKNFPGVSPKPDPQGVSSRIAYESYDFPWPISNDWAVHKYRFDASKYNEKKYSAKWFKVYEKNKIGSAGSWSAEPFPGVDGATLMKYSFRTKAKKGIALVLFKVGVKKSISNLVKALRSETEKRSK